jgi:hypothetical protein
LAGKEEGDISQLDIANSLRFNNGLTLLTVTAEELLEIIEHGISATEDGATPGQFPQVAGIAFSFDDDLPAGDRIQSLAIKDSEDNIIDIVAENGQLVGDSNRTFRIVTLSFLADGGDGYPFPDRDRVDLAQPETATRTGVATFAEDGSEQDILAEYLAANFRETPFTQEDTSFEEDERIQNLDFRQDTVLNGDSSNGDDGEVAIYDIQGEGHLSPFAGELVKTKGIGGNSNRGTINISPDDFNPERIQIQFDSGILPDFSVDVNVGDRLGNVTGVLGYNFGNYEVNVTETFIPTSANLKAETTNLVGSDRQLTVASYNVLNLDPNDNDGDKDVADGRFEAIAAHIVNNLNQPDII